MWWEKSWYNCVNRPKMCQFFIQEVISRLWNDNVALKWQTLSLKTQLKTIKQGKNIQIQTTGKSAKQLFLFFLQVTTRTHTQKKKIPSKYKLRFFSITCHQIREPFTPVLQQPGVRPVVRGCLWMIKSSWRRRAKPFMRHTFPLFCWLTPMRDPLCWY